MDKATLRQYMRERLVSISDDKLQARSKDICQRVIATIDWQTTKYICCYQSIKRLQEVDTSSLIETIRTNYANVSVDVVGSQPNTPLPNQLYDVIIVPLLAFDESGDRLGRGGGWYDRFLAAQPQSTTIGLAYREQRVSSVFPETHDIQLDYVVSI